MTDIVTPTQTDNMCPFNIKEHFSKEKVSKITEWWLSFINKEPNEYTLEDKKTIGSLMRLTACHPKRYFTSYKPQHIMLMGRFSNINYNTKNIKSLLKKFCTFNDTNLIFHDDYIIFKYDDINGYLLKIFLNMHFDDAYLTDNFNSNQESIITELISQIILQTTKIKPRC